MVWFSPEFKTPKLALGLMMNGYMSLAGQELCQGKAAQQWQSEYRASALLNAH